MSKKEFLKLTCMAYVSDPEKAKGMGIVAEYRPEPICFDPNDIDMVAGAYRFENGQPATSITFKSGESFLAVEDFDEVMELLKDYISIKNP